MVKKCWQMMVIATLLLAGVPAWPVSAVEEPPLPHLGYGMLVAHPPTSVEKVKAAGFNWFKYFVYWNDIEPARNGVYHWDTVDWRLNEACAQGLYLLLRVERDRDDWRPIQDHEMDSWQALFQALAAHIAQERATCAASYRVALEIWNEPNLDFQWNYEPVDPARYTEMVKRAYQGAKAGDWTIPIVAGSLAPTGGLPEGRAMNDVDFLEAMYENGLSGHFDAISIHNYGFGGEPEEKTPDIVNFRRAEDIYAVMVAHGDGNKSVWSTEFGWLLDAVEEGVDCESVWKDMGFDWQKVSAEEQADYLQRAFAYADANWPWMGVMFVSNLDFSMTGWYATCDPMNWFAVLKPDGVSRLAYTALQEMDKRPGVVASFSVEPAAFDWSMRLRERDAIGGIVTETVTVLSDEFSFTWNAMTATLGLPFTITPTLGGSGGTFQVVVDARELPVGVYTGVITVSAVDILVTPHTITIPLELDIWGMWGMDVRPPSLNWMMAVSDTHPVSATVAVVNTGDFEFEWTVTQASALLPMTIVPASSTQTGTTFIPGTFRVFVDPRGLPVGLYTGTLTVTASTAQVPQSPFVLPVSVRILERLYSVYIPLVMRRY